MEKKIDIEENKRLIESYLLATKRPGMENLLKYMEENGFYTSPCSGSFHLCCEGGLAEHSLNVVSLCIKVSERIDSKINYDSIYIASLLHDLGKMGQYGKPNYIPNMIKDGKPTKDEPEQKYKVSDSKPYETNKDLLYVYHEIRSIQIASQFIALTEEESFAILYHNGMYSNLKYALNGKETPLQMILHFSDLWVSRVTELK